MEEDDFSYFYALGVSAPRASFFEVNIMKKNEFNTKKMVLLAMFAAISYVIVLIFKAFPIPIFSAAPFLTYEPKDVIITISAFLFGPISSAIISLIVSLIEIPVSGTGPIGAIMNFLSTCAFACTAGIIYKKWHTGKGALFGLLSGSVAMIAMMLLWNWLITPLYMGFPREAVIAMLVPVFLPFNALKAGLNTAITLFLYKPLVTALRKARLVEAAPVKKAGAKTGIYLVAALLLITCILCVLVLRGIL